MIYTKDTKKAMRTAYKAHHKQVDIGGTPYIFHPIHVAEQMSSEEGVIVALLHDVIEDTDITIKELRRRGFSEDVLVSLEAITKKENESYSKYLKRVSEDEVAKAVKIEDLKHNMDLTRLKKVTDKTKKRISKYEDALCFLQN